MQLTLNTVAKGLNEVTVSDSLNTGVMNIEQSVSFTVDMLSLLDDLLSNVGLDLSSKMVGNLMEMVELEASDAA